MTSRYNQKILDSYNFKSVYRISSNGKVTKHTVDKKTGEKKVKELKPFKTKDGYVEYVLVTKDGKPKHIQAHLLTALVYLKRPLTEKKLHVNHKDGNRSNNDVRNLEWLTISENAKHSYKELGKVPWNKKK